MSGIGVSSQAAWYVLHTKPRQEFRALEQLRNQDYHCYLPTLQVDRIRQGKLESAVEPLFSRYLFIRLDMVASNWAPIRSTRGVSRMVAFGGRYATLPDPCIEALQSEEGVKRESLFDPGDRVAIRSGPFAGLEGIYQLSDGEARALVLVELMSQPQRLKLAVETLRKVA